MQTDLDQGSPVASLQGPRSAVQDRLLRPAELDDGPRANAASLENLTGTARSQEIGGVRGKRWWQRPSPVIWRLCAMVADGALLVVLLGMVLVLAAPLHLQFQALSGPFGIRDAKF